MPTRSTSIATTAMTREVVTLIEDDMVTTITTVIHKETKPISQRTSSTQHDARKRRNSGMLRGFDEPHRPTFDYSNRRGSSRDFGEQAPCFYNHDHTTREFNNCGHLPYRNNDTQSDGVGLTGPPYQANVFNSYGPSTFTGNQHPEADEQNHPETVGQATTVPAETNNDSQLLFRHDQNVENVGATSDDRMTWAPNRRPEKRKIW